MRRYARTYKGFQKQQRGAIINFILHLKRAIKRLFPESRISDKHRCDKAKISKQICINKAKPEFVLDMIDKEVAGGVKLGRIGGDGLYGCNTQFTYGLEARIFLLT